MLSCLNFLPQSTPLKSHPIDKEATVHKCRRYCLALGLVLSLLATGCATELDGDIQNPGDDKPGDKPGDTACLTVSFSYTPSSNVKEWSKDNIHNVLVVGSFNGYAPSAQSGAIAMTRQQDGSWTATHTFSKREQIHYSFVANTIYWESGSATQTVSDYFGGFFAVKDVCASTPVPERTLVFRYLDNKAPSMKLMGLNGDWNPNGGITMTKYGDQLWFATVLAKTVGMGKHEYKYYSKDVAPPADWRYDPLARITDHTNPEDINNYFIIDSL